MKYTLLMSLSSVLVASLLLLLALGLLVTSQSNIAISNAVADRTTTINFDPPNFSEGQTVDSFAGITFPEHPVIFKPTSTSTSSSPNALRSAASCSSTDCPVEASQMRIEFSQGARSVSLKAGTDGEFTTDCFPEGRDCGLYVRMIGYDTLGNIVADSRDVRLAENVAVTPITVDVSISDSVSRISSVMISFGKSMFASYHENVEGQVQIDDLIIVFPDSYVPFEKPAVPSISISSPRAGQAFNLDSEIELRGRINAAGGLLAFCASINSPVAPTPEQCSHTSNVGANNEFMVFLSGRDLNPLNNRIYAFAYDYYGQLGTVTLDILSNRPYSPRISFCCYSDTAFSATAPSLIHGSVSSLSHIVAFCLLQNESSVPSQNSCGQVDKLDTSTSSSGFNSFDIPVDINKINTQGVNTWYAYAWDDWGQRGFAKLEIRLPIDIKITAMEITQGIQTDEIQENTLSFSGEYEGVRLVQGKKTVARVFVGMSGEGPLSIRAVSVLLEGWTHNSRGDLVPLGYIFPKNGLRDLSPGNSTFSRSQRIDHNGGFIFDLPQSWTFNNEILLKARMNFIGYHDPNTERTTWLRNNEFSVANVRFEPSSYVQITPVELVYRDSSGNLVRPSDPAQVFSRFKEISPSTRIVVEPYRATLDVTAFVTAFKVGALDATDLSWRLIQSVAGVEALPGFADRGGYTVGVIKDVSGNVGMMVPLAFPSPVTLIRFEPIAVVSEMTGFGSRPLTNVAHETYHSIGFYHAGEDCPKVSLATFWDPGNRGNIFGIGLDIRDGSGRSRDTYRVIADRAWGVAPSMAPPSTPPAEWFDLMSYCITDWLRVNGDYNAWISVRNWNSFGYVLPNTNIIRSTTVANPTEEDTITVSALVDEDGKIAISGLSHFETGAIITGKDESPFGIVAQKRDGVIVFNATLNVVKNQVDMWREGAASDRHMMLYGVIPATDTDVISITKDDRLMAQAIRSEHSPSVSLIEPTENTVVSNAQNEMIVRWDAADDDDGDELVARISYSTDAGRTFNLIAAGISGNQFEVPTRLLKGSGTAQVKITVSDGFNESSVVSSSFTVQANAPSVRILQPSPNMETRDDVYLSFAGEAFDDSGTSLDDLALSWYVDGNFIGKGQQIDAGIFPIGEHRVRLEAVDTQGNVGTSEGQMIVVKPAEYDGKEPRAFTIASVLDNRIYVINGSSTTSKATSFSIVPNESITLRFNGEGGKVFLDLPKDLITGIYKVTDGAREIDFQLKENASNLRITFDVPDNTPSVIIYGTKVIPEFPVSVTAIPATIITFVILLNRLGKRNL